MPRAVKLTDVPVRIVGAGLQSPLGDTFDAVWARLLRAETAADVLAIEYVDQTRSFVVGACAPDAGRVFPHAERRRMDRLHILGISAALDACDAAGGNFAGPRTAVICGVGLPSPGLLEREHTLAIQQPRAVNPLVIPLTMLNGLAAEIARRLEATGPCQTISTACASGADAIGLAMLLLGARRADRVVVVGADAPLVPSVLHFFGQLAALTSRTAAPAAASCPFGADRDGFVLSEGAAAVVLERRDESTDRGLGVLAGYGASTDAHHLTAPHPQGRGARQAIATALRAAGVRPQDVVSVNSHGTSTRHNDAVEASVITDCFRPEVLVTATKASTGHMIGASGVFEALVAARSALTGLVPPVGDYPLDAGGISVVTHEATHTEPGPVVSPSFGFGGQNAVLVFSP